MEEVKKESEFANNLFAMFQEMKAREDSKVDQYKHLNSFTIAKSMGFWDNQIINAIEQVGDDADLVVALLYGQF